MKFARAMFALTLTMLPLLASAQLKGSDRIVTQVPFEFVVANRTIPAGECVVQSASMNGKTMIIRNRAAKVSLFSMISAAEDSKTAGTYALVFHRYGDQYFLWGMRLDGTRTIYRLPESKAELELRAQNVPATEKILLASLQ
jgi:hypothetical protein